MCTLKTVFHTHTYLARHGHFHTSLIRAHFCIRIRVASLGPTMDVMVGSNSIIGPYFAVSSSIRHADRRGFAAIIWHKKMCLYFAHVKLVYAQHSVLLIVFHGTAIKHPNLSKISSLMRNVFLLHLFMHTIFRFWTFSFLPCL